MTELKLSNWDWNHTFEVVEGLSKNKRRLLGLLGQIEKEYPKEILTNNYLAAIIKVTSVTISNYLKDLEQKNYISVKVYYYKNVNVKLGKTIKVLLKS